MKKSIKKNVIIDKCADDYDVLDTDYFKNTPKDENKVYSNLCQRNIYIV